MDQPDAEAPINRKAATAITATTNTAFRSDETGQCGLTITEKRSTFLPTSHTLKLVETIVENRLKDYTKNTQILLKHLFIFKKKHVVRTSDQSIIDRQGILMQILLVAGSKMSVRGELYKSTVLRYLFTGWVLANDCFHRHSSQEPTCANSRNRSRLNHLLTMRPRNS